MFVDLRAMFSDRGMAISLLCGFIASLVVGYGAYRYQSPLASFNAGDAAAYLASAKGVKELFASLAIGIRTYGYITILWIFSAPFQWFQIETHWISFTATVIHISVLALVACILASTVSKDAGIRKVIVFGIVLNPFLLALAPLTLTEIPSVLMMALVYIARCRIVKSDSRALVMGLLSGFAVELRPANLWLLGAAALVVFLDAARTGSGSTKRPLIVFVVGMIIPMLPQMIFNGITFGRYTALTAGGLAGNQLVWGRDWLRLGFVLRLPDQVLAVITENPFKIGGVLPFKWISLDGPAYGIMKILSFFIYERIFVYQIEPNRLAAYLVMLMSSFAVYFGFSGIIKSAKKLDDYHFVPVIIAIVFCVILYLPTALENRFSIQAFAILFPFAFYCLIYVKKSIVFIIGFLLFFATSAAINGMFQSLSSGFRLMASEGRYFGQ